MPRLASSSRHVWPCLRRTTATATTAGLVSSTIKLLLHHHLPLQKTNKNQIQREREKDRQREICRTVVEWWWTASVTSHDGRQRDHSFNYSTCTKIKAMQKRDDGSKTYNKRPLTEAVEDGERWRQSSCEGTRSRDLLTNEKSGDAEASS